MASWSYSQSPTNPYKIWCQTREQFKENEDGKRINQQYEKNNKSKYFARNIGFYKNRHQYSDEEINEFLERDWNLNKHKFWSHPAQLLASNVLWCEEFSLHEIRQRISEIKNKRIKAGTFKALINHTEFVPYHPSTEAFGSSFYPGLLIRFKKEVKE